MLDRGGATASEPDVPWRTLFENAPYLVLALLPDAPRFTMIAATRERFAATHVGPETIGQGLFDVFTDDPGVPEADGVRNLRASLARVLATRAPDTMAVQKYDIRGPDGSFMKRFWSPRNVPILGPSGEVQLILHCVEDVTGLVNATEAGDELRDRTRVMEREVLARSRELAEAVSELRRANEKLGELDVAKTTFFANVSHELRTPLTLVLGPLQDMLVDEGDELHPHQRARLELALGNTRRLHRLVNTLLDFSRIEAGRLRATFAPVELGPLTAELSGMFHSAAKSAGLSLVVDCPPLGEPIWVDRDMWEKIVTNLVGNAHKYTLTGSVTVRTRLEGDGAVLEVSDTGVGIPASELAKVFDRFHRVAGTDGRTFEGTGIGLSFVKELVALHGGRITVESVVGSGTTFRVVVPRGHRHLPGDAIAAAPPRAEVGRAARAQAEEIARWSAAPYRPAPESDGRRPRVLLVEDNADLRRYMTSLLEPHYHVTLAVDGTDALAQLEGTLPDVVVSDVMMPRTDGIMLVRELRRRERTRAIPVILLSAQAGEDASIAGLDAGADDYVMKPFGGRELLARVRTHVELAAMRRAYITALEDANRELDAFSYSVSHDLRAPLRAIDGFSKILLDEHAANLDAEGRKYLGWVRASAGRMSELIDALLGLARVTRAPLVRRRVDVTKLVHEVSADLTARDGRTVATEIQDGMVAWGDERLLRAVFENLIGNARKFTSKREGPRIEVGTTLTDGQRTFFVRDDGAGFDMTYAKKLFGAFQRLHPSSEFEGHGIGLATVQRIVRRHGGRVWATGVKGEGATFFFTLGDAAPEES
jgi:signal transduction histidine kinase